MLADPVIKLTGSGDRTVAENDDWNLASNAVEIARTSSEVGAFILGSGARDAALLVELSAGQYTLTCSGKNNAEGVALVEIYYVP